MPEREDEVNVAKSGGDRDGVSVTWVLGIVATLIVTGILAVGSALYTMNGRLSSMEAKVDLILAERAPRYRGENHVQRD